MQYISKSATTAARLRLLLYVPTIRSGGRQCIKQGFPKTGGVIRYMIFLTPRSPKTWRFFVHQTMGIEKMKKSTLIAAGIALIFSQPAYPIVALEHQCKKAPVSAACRACQGMGTCTISVPGYCQVINGKAVCYGCYKYMNATGSGCYSGATYVCADGYGYPANNPNFLKCEPYPTGYEPSLAGNTYFFDPKTDNCAAGYYKIKTPVYTMGAPMYYTYDCIKCPNGGTSDVGAESITKCYLPSGTTDSDSTGKYTYTSKCYYKN